VTRVELKEKKEVKSYRDLVAWQKSMALVSGIYEATKFFPKEEQFGLTAQLRRAAVSIPSNIAEGSSRRATKEFIRFINIANGSLAETETQLQLANDLGFLEEDSLNLLLEKTDEISRILQGLYNSLNSRL